MSRVVGSIRVLFIVLLFAAVAVAQQGKYQEITCPDQTGITVATGLNDAGQVVGFVLGGDKSVGFIWDKSGTCTIVGSDWGIPNIWLMGINDSDQIVGVSFTSDFSLARAFIYHKGQKADISIPKSIAGAEVCQVVAFGINNRGDVVGFFDTNCSGEGGPDIGYIRRSDGTIEVVPNPDSNGDSINVNGINPRGDTVGEYLSGEGNSEINKGFLRHADGNFEEAIQPENAALTRATGINPRGEVVGTYYVGPLPEDLEQLGPLGPCFGFFRATDETMHDLAYPEALHTCIMGINASGDITGAWTKDNFSWHAFIADKSFFGLK